MNEKVTLYFYQDENIKINIAAYIDDSGHLRIEGYDIGKSVKKLKGSSDCEYFITVKNDFVPLLKNFLIQKNESLLEAIKNKFNNNRAFSSFKEYLKKNNIEFEQFYWN